MSTHPHEERRSCEPDRRVSSYRDKASAYARNTGRGDNQRAHSVNHDNDETVADVIS